MLELGEGRTAARVMDTVETEWQFEAADLEALRGSMDALAERGGVSLKEMKPRNIRDLYLDTGDWRFYRAGYALRMRRVGKRTEATMKSLASQDGGGPRRRREISEPIRLSRGTKTGTPGALAEALFEALRGSAGPVGERASALAGPREPRLLFEVRTRRQVFKLLPPPPEGDSHDGIAVDADGGIRSADGALALGEVAFDETEISLGRGRGAVLLRRVEIETAGEESEGAARFAGVLRTTPGLSPVGASKFETGLDAAGLVPEGVPELGLTGVDESMSVSEFAFAVLRRHFVEALLHEPGVRIGEDPEELHDMRVAIRRLRSTLKLYAEHLPRKAERFERDLDHFGGVLGEVRDLDVQIERLSTGEGVPEVVIPALHARRTQKREQMLAELDSSRYERLVKDMSGTLRRGRAPAAPPILERAPGLVADQHKKVMKRVKRVSGSSKFEELHDLRKKGRRMRYAVEPLVAIYGKPAGKMVEQLKKLQDVFGEQQDKTVTAELLEEVALSGDLPPEAVFYMGAEAERRRREADEMRRGIAKAKALRGVRKGDTWKRLWKAMEEHLIEKAKKG